MIVTMCLGRLRPVLIRSRAVAAILLVSGLCALPLRAQNKPEGDRIVAIGGAVTEIIYALKQGERIVGVDTTSVFPTEALTAKPNVGYMRALSIEGILSLKPTRIISIEGAGPPDVLKQIEAAGVPLTMIKDEQTPEGVLAKIAAIGALVGGGDAAKQLQAATAARFAEIAAARARIDKPMRILFVLSLQNGRVLAGGRGTAADAMIRLAGGINAADAFEGYKPMSDEAVIGVGPEAVMMMNAGNHAPDIDIFALPAFSATPAAGRKVLIAMDGLYLLGFGPRTPDALRDLIAALYPALPPPVLSPLPTP